MPAVIVLAVPSVQHSKYIRKTYFQAAVLHQNLKTSAVLFAFPRLIPILTAPLLWLRLALLHTVCQCTRRKAKWEPCTKTLPCSVVNTRPGTPCTHFTWQTHNLSLLRFCVCAITLMRVVAG